MLDNQELYSEIDKSGMLETIAQYPEQILEAIEIVNNMQIPDFIKIDNIIVTGMGASAISGDIVESLFRDKIDIPIYVNREYELPKWAKKDTLTIFLSYSGDTEETISSFKMACQKKCKILCVSSGGKLQELSEKRGIIHIKIPSGFQPRAATAYLLFPLILIFKRNGLLKNFNIDSDIEETIDLIKEFVNNNKKTIPEENNLSKQLAKEIIGAIPQIYGWGIYSSLAMRWRCQFNENSKIISRYDVVPECNHNDLVGWSADLEVTKKFSCVIFRDKDEESLRISKRLDFMKTLFKETSANVVEVYPKGKSRLAKMIYLKCLGDFISCYIAMLKKVDPTPIDVITELKNHLSEI